MCKLPVFEYWCRRVLPIVYDDSLTTYELLCKVLEYINGLIEQDNVFANDINSLKDEVNTINNWIANFDTSYAESIIEKHIATMIFLEINDEGYIVYHIPESWDDITFNTTGLDISIPEYPEFGLLTLSY